MADDAENHFARRGQIRPRYSAAALAGARRANSNSNATSTGVDTAMMIAMAAPSPLKFGR